MHISDAAVREIKSAVNRDVFLIDSAKEFNDGTRLGFCFGVTEAHSVDTDKGDNGKEDGESEDHGEGLSRRAVLTSFFITFNLCHNHSHGFRLSKAILS